MYTVSIPTTLQPLILAIWPTKDPTAPAAPVTTRVSPAFGVHILRKPKYAVALWGLEWWWSNYQPTTGHSIYYETKQSLPAALPWHTQNTNSGGRADGYGGVNPAKWQW